LYKWLPLSNKQDGDLSTPGEMGEITLQVGVGGKTSVEIGRIQESVATVNLYDNVKDLWLGSSGEEKHILDVYLGRLNVACVH